MSALRSGQRSVLPAEVRMKVYVCDICGYRYDESKEKVLWEDLPEDWVCPLCGVGKDQFSLLKDSSGVASAEGDTASCPDSGPAGCQ